MTEHLLRGEWQRAAAIEEGNTGQPGDLASALAAMGPALRPGARSDEHADVHPAPPGCLGVLLQGRIAVLRGDPAALARVVHEGESDLPGRLAAGWLAWMRADAAALEAACAGLDGDAEASESGAARIERVILRGLARSLRGELDEALAFARQAARMARAENAPLQTLLSDLTLARARRLTGKVHLAGFILRSMVRYVPAVMRPWVRAEALLCGVPATALGDDDNGDTVVDRLLVGAACGDGEAIAAAMGSLDAAPLPAPLLREVRALHAMLDARVDDPAVAGWRRGVASDAPLGLDGGYGTEVVTAWVWAAPDAPGRRVLAAGLPLYAAHQLDLSGHPRVATLAAVLALAGPSGLSEEEAFQRVYGFAYVADRHAGTRRVLLHRARAMLQPHAAIEVREGRMQLTSTAPVLVPDGRCVQRPEQAILNLFVTHRRIAPRDVAIMTGTPLRTVHDVLKRLATDGLCQSVRRGRAVEYEVKDTTYTAPSWMPFVPR